ncbi:uncharacterized protein LOC132194732 [Neocloeon triangulifer]|uniref:uncharacterized protein LOC132194732 n=1 Tax=Neocloeon triangulifer TaxID=2078957 RepID=UPI00286F723C|nr:uncharacterized protein LOC132194732 [Neocloeon triangulifer]
MFLVFFCAVCLGLSTTLAQVPDADGNTGPDPRKIYDFNFQAPTHGQRVASDINGDVRGRYFYTDDMGIQRTVDYTAGKDTGFVVQNDTPDPNPANEASYYKQSRPGAAFGTYEGTRGYLSSKLNGDGSYNFKLSSPHQSRSENKDVFGRVQGEYKYLDTDGKMHFVQYEAGPDIGYRVLNTNDGKPTPVAAASTTQTRYAEARSGRAYTLPDEVLEGAYSEYYGSKRLSESAVKVKNHGENTGKENSGDKEKSVKIAWSPILKKPTGLEGKFFKNSAEEYERAPSADAVDFFSGEDQGDYDFSNGKQQKRKSPFIITVPEPVFAAATTQVFDQHPFAPLSPQEQSAVNNLKDYTTAVIREQYRVEDLPDSRVRQDDVNQNYAASNFASRRWHSGEGESLVNNFDIVHLRSRLSPHTPRLAQVISLD